MSKGNFLHFAKGSLTAYANLTLGGVSTGIKWHLHPSNTCSYVYISSADRPVLGSLKQGKIKIQRHCLPPYLRLDITILVRSSI